MRITANRLLVAGFLAGALPFPMSAWAAPATTVTCPSAACTCEEVKVHTCDARPNGTLYNCRDVTETHCTIVSGPGSGKAVMVPGGGKKTIKMPVTNAPNAPTMRR